MGLPRRLECPGTLQHYENSSVSIFDMKLKRFNILNLLQPGTPRLGHQRLLVRPTSHRIQMMHQRRQIHVLDRRLESQPMPHGTGKRIHEVDSRQLA